MSRSDYAHHNEEADAIWWLEEGRHSAHDEPYDEPYDGRWDWQDDDEDDESDESENWQAEDAAMESSLFGDC